MSTQNNSDMSGQRRRRLSQPYEPRRRSRSAVLGTESVPAEMLNNSDDRVHDDIPYNTNTTSCYSYNLPVFELPPPQSAQTASEPALGSSDSHRYSYFTGPYYYRTPTQSAIIARQGNYWPLAGTGNSHREDGLGMSSVVCQPNSISDSDPWSILIGRSPMRQWSDSPLAGSSHWTGTSSTSQFLNPFPGSVFIQPQQRHDQFMSSNIGNLAQIGGAAAGADIPVNANNYGRGTLSFNPVRDTDFHSTVQFQNSIRPGFPETNAVALPPQTSLRTDMSDQVSSAVYGLRSPYNNTVDILSSYMNALLRNSGSSDAAHCMTTAAANVSNGVRDAGTSECMNANMAEDAMPVKRRPGRPCKSSSTNNGDSKRPDKSTIEVNMLQIQIGQWQRTCEPGRETDLSAKCYSKQHKLLWDIFCLEKTRKDRIVMEWKSIESMEAIPHSFQLKIKLSKPPSFCEELIGNPKVHSSWPRADDFTKGEALRDRVVHTLVFKPESYETYINFLLKFEQLRALLNTGMNVAVAVAPRAETILNTHVALSGLMYYNNMQMNDVAREWNYFDDDNHVQVNEAGASEDMELAVFNGGRVNDASGMSLLMSEFLDTDSLLPGIGNGEDVLPEVPSTSCEDIIDISEFLDTDSLLPEIGNGEDVLPEVPSTFCDDFDISEFFQ